MANVQVQGNTQHEELPEVDFGDVPVETAVINYAQKYSGHLFTSLTIVIIDPQDVKWRGISWYQRY